MISVTHSAGTYPVLVEPGLLERLPGLVARYLPGRATALITDSNVDALYADYLAGVNVAWNARPRTCDDPAAAGWRIRYAFAAGEISKTRETWAALSDQLIGAGHGRGSAIVALGGGVAGDLAGFVAATFMRGIPYVQVPTTLLAMVDASVGGKTGVDTAAGKNLIGAFHPPVAVLADPLVLATLSARNYRSGLAEAVKHGAVADEGYFDWLTGNATAIAARDPVAVTSLVERSVAIKAAIVAADERESGQRAVLNAGHTVGHAIEAASGYTLTHGDAVAIGLRAECMLGERMDVTAAGIADRVGAALDRFGLPVSLPTPLPVERVLAAMAADKKGRDGMVRFALIRAIGQPAKDGDCWTGTAPEAEIVASLRAIGCF